MSKLHSISAAIQGIRQMLTKALRLCDAIEDTARQGRVEADEAFALVNHTEQAVMLARQMYGGLAPPREAVPCKPMEMAGRLSRTDYGLTVNLPALLPSRRKDSRYIRAVIRDLCADGGRSFMRDVVIAVEQQYAPEIPLKAWRDHDNVELAGLLNELSLCLLAGDNPEDVDLFQYATRGEQNAAIIHIVEREKLPAWAAEKWGKNGKNKKADFTPCETSKSPEKMGTFAHLYEPTVRKGST